MTEEELKKDALDRWSKALRKERLRKRCGTFDRKHPDTALSSTDEAIKKKADDHQPPSTIGYLDQFDRQHNNAILEQYLPWARDAEAVVEILTRMGIKEGSLEKVFRGNPNDIYGKIIDPDTNKEHWVTYATVQLKSKGKEWSLTVNCKPYKHFFEELDNEEATLAKAAKENKLVAQLLTENKELKRMLSLIGNV